MWHCIEIFENDGEFTVNCIPHGEISVQSTHYAAFLAALTHDVENGTSDVLRGA